MKKINFTQAGGFPLEEKTLDTMQTAYFDVLKTIIGHFGLPSVGNFIIYGCEVVANTIQPGMMYIDGDLCFFAVSNGNLTTKIKKIETIEDAPFEGGNNLPTYFDYSALVNANGVLLSDFERLPKVQELINQVINWADISNIPNVVIDPFMPNQTPAQLTILERLELLEKKNAVFQAGGAMVLWNKPANLIEPGWHEVIDWKGRIPVGVDNRLDLIGGSLNPEFQSLSSTQIVPGKTGGDKGTQIVNDNLPQTTVNSNGLTQNGNTDSSPGGGTPYYQPAGNNSTTFGKAIPDKVNVLNPYRTVLFIEYTGV